MFKSGIRKMSFVWFRLVKIFILFLVCYFLIYLDGNEDKVPMDQTKLQMQL